MKGSAGHLHAFCSGLGETRKGFRRKEKKQNEVDEAEESKGTGKKKQQRIPQLSHQVKKSNFRPSPRTVGERCHRSLQPAGKESIGQIANNSHSSTLIPQSSRRSRQKYARNSMSSSEGKQQKGQVCRQTCQPLFHRSLARVFIDRCPKLARLVTKHRCCGTMLHKGHARSRFRSDDASRSLWTRSVLAGQTPTSRGLLWSWFLGQTANGRFVFPSDWM